MRTTIYQVVLYATEEVFEIITEENVNNTINCSKKDKLINLIDRGNVTRTRQLESDLNGELVSKEIPIDRFMEIMSTISK